MGDEFRGTENVYVELGMRTSPSRIHDPVLVKHCLHGFTVVL